MTRAAWADAAGGHRVSAVAAGRRRFAILNHAINPLVRWLMRSPLHWLASRRVALISYTGRRSGRRFTIRVGYEMPIFT